MSKKKSESIEYHARRIEPYREYEYDGHTYWQVGAFGTSRWMIMRPDGTIFEVKHKHDVESAINEDIGDEYLDNYKELNFND